jgi:hypothetical protein
MTEIRTKPSLIGYLALFAGIYSVMLFLAGLAKTYLALKSDLNSPVLVTAGILVGSAFVWRRHRQFTGTEVVKLSLGTFAIDLMLQLGVMFLMTDDREWLASWLVWFVLFLHLAGLFFIFGCLTKVIGKSILEAIDKKTPNQTPGGVHHPDNELPKRSM